METWTRHAYVTEPVSQLIEHEKKTAKDLEVAWIAYFRADDEYKTAVAMAEIFLWSPDAGLRNDTQRKAHLRLIKNTGLPGDDVLGYRDGDQSSAMVELFMEVKVRRNQAYLMKGAANLAKMEAERATRFLDYRLPEKM